MRIDHIAIWTRDLEQMKKFYCTYFGAIASKPYHNPVKQFSSYFLTFSEGSRIELMHKPGIESSIQTITLGLAHFAISVGSREKVDELTDRLRKDSFGIVGEPRVTGDGYYESIAEDPEGNWIEITE